MYYVYILASRHYGTLYAGSTTNLARRIAEHRAKVLPGFTAKYGVDRLVWYEAHDSFEAMLTRERRIKGWKRDWKINLIEQQNPHWVDLYSTLPP
jgi:putative endonuclease